MTSTKPGGGEERVLSSHQLTVRFDQLENNRISWHLQADDRIERTLGLSLTELAGRGAPLAALGIRVLLKLCTDGLVNSALGQADEIRGLVVSRAPDDGEDTCETRPEGVTIQ